MNDTEVEVKYHVTDAEGLRGWLDKNAKRASSKRTVDRYYTPAHRDFLEPEIPVEWLRLRDTEGECSLDYKRWHLRTEDEAFHCDEYVAGISSLAAFQKILAALDFRELVAVDKNRTKYLYGDWEYCLDEVKGLGWFLEMEYAGAPRGVEEIIPMFDGLAMELAPFLGEKEKRGYPYRLLERNKRLYSKTE